MARSRLAESWSELIPFYSTSFVFVVGVWLLPFGYFEYAALAAGSSGTFGYFDSASVSLGTLHPSRVQQFNLLMVAAIGWGSYRALVFNPFFQREYFAFLNTVPWTDDKPLPLGPLRLTLGDGLVWALLSLLIARGYLHGWAFPFIGGLIGYALPIALMLYITGQRIWFFALACTFVSIPYTFTEPWVITLWLCAAVILLVLAVRASLQAFPWDKSSQGRWSMPEKWTTFDLSEWFGARRFAWYRATIDGGWPLGAMSPAAMGDRDAYGTRIAWCFLAGWSAAAFAPVQLTLDQGLVDYFSLWLGFAAFYGFMRSGYFRVYCSQPIGYWGRFFTLRWIIPRFDVINVPALVGIGWVAGVTLLVVKLDLLQLVPIRILIFFTVAVGTSLVAIAPPQSRRWWLTGGYRGKPQKYRYLRRL